MSTTFRSFAITAAALAAVPSLAQQGAKQAYDDQSKEGLYERMHSLAQEIEALRSRGATPEQVERAMAQYQALSARFGGDDPGRLIGEASSPASASPSSLGAPLTVVAPTCSGSAATTTNFPGTTGPIPDTSPPVTLTTTVSTLDTYLWDLNLNTSITHTENADLDIRLTSPAGTVVTVTTDNGSTNDNVFNGTLWDDNVNLPVTDAVYANLVVETPVSPEGRFQAFRGENPNGTWTLTVFDDLATDTGSVGAWSLDISTLSAAPTLTTTTQSNTPGLAIVDLVAVTDGMTFASLDTYLVEVELYTEITHTFAADLDLTLISPALTAVVFSTDNGGGNDNVFNGTTWDVDAPNAITDIVTTNLVVVPSASPEGAFDNFLGQDPNGLWVLSVFDDAGGDTGTVVRWDLSLTTTTPAPTPSAPVNYVGGGTPAAITDPSNPPAVTFTSVVGGMGSYLWDVDLNAAIPHTASADLDMTLTSPGLTTIVVSTDNGGLNDNVFNGTLWDAQANDATTDHVYVNNVVATPMNPEGSLDAFRGEDPNGTWTLTIDDDFIGDAGSVSSWSLDVTTYTAAPVQCTLTTSRAPAMAIVDVGTISDSMTVSNLGSAASKVVLYTEITHTFAADLDVFLTSPALTTVPITTDNGGGNDNVFNGTTWDPDGTDTVTDHVYANLVVATPLTPEGSLGAFIGQDPNGTWTLTVTDDLGGDVGVLVRWDLTISTCGVCPPVVYCGPIGPTAGGCLPTISAPIQPDPTHSSGCTITVSNVDGLRTGFIYYGVVGPAAASWCGPATGNSTRCVLSPVKRTYVQDSGGTSGLCDGTLFLDWDDFQINKPGAPGQPFSPGDKAWVQGWFRSPLDCKFSFMSEAVELTYQ